MTTQQTKGMPDKGSSQARVAAKQDRRKDEEALDVSALTAYDDGSAPLTAEEHRKLKLLEALNVRAQLDKLLRDNNIRIAEERRAALNKENV
jgi:hypothetical protein